MSRFWEGGLSSPPNGGLENPPSVTAQTGAIIEDEDESPPEGRYVQ